MYRYAIVLIVLLLAGCGTDESSVVHDPHISSDPDTLSEPDTSNESDIKVSTNIIAFRLLEGGHASNLQSFDVSWNSDDVLTVMFGASPEVELPPWLVLFVNAGLTQKNVVLNISVKNDSDVGKNHSVLRIATVDKLGSVLSYKDIRVVYEVISQSSG
jgi:hypothetical protein